MGKKFNTVSPLDWVKALADPAYDLAFDLSGFPMFFDARPGWRALLRRFDQHIVYFCRSGSFAMEAAGHSGTVRAGEMIWVQPGVEFQFQIIGDGSARIVRFRLHVGRRKGKPLRLRKPFLYLKKTGLAHTWHDQIRLLANAPGAYAHAGLRAALAGFFATALDAGSRHKKEPRQRALTPGQFANLEHFVELRGSAPCAPADLAAHLQLAPAYFNRLFRAAFRRSARAWLIDRRIHAAAQQLVESTRRVGEIADEFGYTSLFFFSRQFRKVLGLSPRQFRHRAQSAK